MDDTRRTIHSITIKIITNPVKIDLQDCEHLFYQDDMEEQKTPVLELKQTHWIWG